jgi:hypothetical protein
MAESNTKSKQHASPRLDKLLPLRHKIFMVVESIREFNRAVPFKPYEIQMASGQRYEVPHPEFILISPRGSYVVLVDADESPHHLSTLLMERVSLLQGRRARKTGKNQPGFKLTQGRVVEGRFISKTGGAIFASPRGKTVILP